MIDIEISTVYPSNLKDYQSKRRETQQISTTKKVHINDGIWRWKKMATEIAMEK